MMQDLVNVELRRRRARLSVAHSSQTVFNIKEANLQNVIEYLGILLVNLFQIICCCRKLIFQRTNFLLILFAISFQHLRTTKMLVLVKGKEINTNYTSTDKKASL